MEHKCSLPCSQEPTTSPIPSQMNPIHTLLPYFPTMHFNIMLPCMPKSSEWSLPFRLYNIHFLFISNLPDACYMPCPSHPPQFDHPNIWQRVQITEIYMKSSIPNNFQNKLCVSKMYLHVVIFCSSDLRKNSRYGHVQCKVCLYTHTAVCNVEFKCVTMKNKDSRSYQHS
jgi:hypothetical protein